MKNKSSQEKAKKDEIDQLRHELEELKQKLETENQPKPPEPVSPVGLPFNPNLRDISDTFGKREGITMMTPQSSAQADDMRIANQSVRADKQKRCVTICKEKKN